MENEASRIDTPPEAAFRKLLHAVQESGDTKALGELLQLHHSYLHVIADLELGSTIRPKVSASDIVQETYAEVQRDIQRFRGQSQEEFQSWLRRILLNNLLNQVRAFRETEKRQISREVSFERAEPQITAGGETPSSEAIKFEESAMLDRALKKLPEHYRIVISMRNREHKDFAEIGEFMGKSPEAARALWARAFSCLAAAVKRHS